MNVRVKKYVSTYKAHSGETVEEVCCFTEAQANSIGAVLEPDGLNLHAAIELVRAWNAERHLVGAEGVYKLFVEKGGEE